MNADSLEPVIDPRPAAARLIETVHDGNVIGAQMHLRTLSSGELRDVAVLLASYVAPDQRLIPLTPSMYLSPAQRVDAVVRFVAEWTGVDMGLIYGKSRHRHVSQARHVTCAASLELGLSGPEVGRALHRDHSCVYRSAKLVSGDPVMHRKSVEIVAHAKARGIV